MNYLKKENGKIKIYVESVNEDKVKKEFVLDISKKSKNEKVYKLKNMILNFNISKLKQKVDVVTEDDLDEATTEYFSEKIVNTNFCALIYLNSYISLQKIDKDKDDYLEYSCPGYTFEITDKSGEVLCTRESENLQLDPESGIGSEILMINSISDSDKTLNIKVYEEITGSLIAEKIVCLK